MCTDGEVERACVPPNVGSRWECWYVQVVVNVKGCVGFARSTEPARQGSCAADYEHLQPHECDGWVMLCEHNVW